MQKVASEGKNPQQKETMRRRRKPCVTAVTEHEDAGTSNRGTTEPGIRKLKKGVFASGKQTRLITHAEQEGGEK